MGNNSASGPSAYTIDLKPDNKIGEGSYAEVYKV